MPLSTTGKILNGIIVGNMVASYLEESYKPAPKKKHGSFDDPVPEKPLTAREKLVESVRFQWKIDNGYMSLDPDYEPTFNTGDRAKDHEHWSIYWGLKEPPMPPSPPGAWSRVKSLFRG